MNKPFLPSEIRPFDPLRDWRKAVAARAVAGVTGRNMPRWASEVLEKAAVAPADTTTPAWAGSLALTRVGAFLRSLRPRSAAAQLLDRAPQFNLTGVASVTLPRLTADYPAPAWVAEGGAIPVVRGTFGTQMLGPVKKLAALSAVTSELATYSAEDAEQIVTELMDDAAAKALDVSMFSTTAASSVQPAGVLNGVTPITGTTGGGMAAMVSDIANLFGAIGDAGGGQDVLIFANARLATTLRLQAGPGFDASRVIATNVLGYGIVVAIDAAAFASGFGAEPRIEVSKNAAVHMESVTPLPLGTAGSPNTVAAPILSAFQQDSHVIRLILQAAWTVRLAGAVQVVTGATW